MQSSGEVTVVLNFLRIRSEDDLKRWAATAFQLPQAPRPYTDYTSDYVRGCISGHAASTRTFFIVRPKYRWLASLTVRNIIFGKNGWKYWLGYPLMHDDGISVHFGD
jgi:hypothetical protein